MAQVLHHHETFESPMTTEYRNPNSDHTASLRRALQELSVGNTQNKNRTSPLGSEGLSAAEGLELLQRLDFGSSLISEVDLAKSKFKARAARRRAAIEPETFEPLDPVFEESSCSLSTESSAATVYTGSAVVKLSDHSMKENCPAPIDPLLAAEPKSPSDEFLKHLAGQFEWLITCPRRSGPAADREQSDESRNVPTKSQVVYGCNLLSRNQRPDVAKESMELCSANTYTLIATPLDGDEHAMPDWDLRTIGQSAAKMELPLPPSYEFCQATSRKELEVEGAISQAVSPALTFVSERSSLFATGSSASGSFSVPRIEDSLEELDKLEEELEAVKAVTDSRRISYPNKEKSRNSLDLHAHAQNTTLLKRSSLAGQAATVRVKNSERARPSIRRSASLIFNDRNRDEATGSPSSKGNLQQQKSINSLSSTPRGTVKSTKPLTVPNFELPGEAVARRLREQREARKAQQAEAQKAYVPPPRLRLSKVLPKPTFELPGEAISRRKREEREARLQAQEEEDRKKREFKAKPVRLSSALNTLPRDTVASRARQGKIAQEIDDGKSQESARSPRLSIGIARGGSISNKSPQTRGRLSTMVSHEDLSRAASSSTGSVSGKRNTLSAEEMQQLKARGKEVFQRDNSHFKKDRDREKREREMAARTAREEAAKRSRAASKEWAEKKRRKEKALRDAMRQGV